MELDARRPSCLHHRPSGLSFCLSAPRHCTRRSPFSNGNGTGTCWGPSAGPTLFLRGEFLDSRAAFVKFSSVGTQNYFFWLNNFIASASPHCGRDACFWVRPALSAQPCAIQSGPSAPVYPHKTEMIKNLSSARRAVPGVLLHSTHQLHTEYLTGCSETASRPKTLHSEGSAVALALALAAPAGPFTPSGDLGNKSRPER